MQATDRPTFDSETSKRIYEYVERHGTAERNMLLDVAAVPSDEFRSRLEGLKSKGYLEEEGGTLRVALEVGTIDEHETDAGTVVIRPGQQTDFEGVVDTIRDVTAEETYVIAESIAEQLLYEEAVTRHNTVKSRIFFVATLDGEVVGWTHLDLPHSPRSGKPLSRRSASARHIAATASAASSSSGGWTGRKPMAFARSTTAYR